MHLMETAKSKTGPKQTAERSMYLLLEKADISKSSFHQPQKLLVRLLLAQITTKQASALAAA